MYLLSREVTLEWELLKTSTPPALGDLDLIFINPNGEEEYVVAPLLPQNYLPPTSTTAGSVTSTFTPHLEGFWRIRLVKGDATEYEKLSKMEFYVFDSTTVTSPFSDDIGKPAPYDINFYLQGFMVANEIYGSFAASRNISLDENVPGSVAICEDPSKFFNTELEILHNGIRIGTILFTPGSLVGQITSDPVLVVIGDKLQIKVTSTLDEYINDVAINLVGCCTVVPCSVF